MLWMFVPVALKTPRIKALWAKSAIFVVVDMLVVRVGVNEGLGRIAKERPRKTASAGDCFAAFSISFRIT